VISLRCQVTIHFCAPERNDLSYPPVVGSLSPVGHAADFLAPGDRLHQIDGISTIGLSNQKVMNMLCAGGSDAGPAIVEIEYSLPEYSKWAYKISPTYRNFRSPLLNLSLYQFPRRSSFPEQPLCDLEAGADHRGAGKWMPGSDVEGRGRLSADRHPCEAPWTCL